MPSRQNNKLAHIRQIAESNDRQQAKALLNDYLKENPSDADAWFLAADVVSDPSRKIQALERCLSLDPDHEDARQALAALQPEAALPPPTRTISTVAFPVPEPELVRTVALAQSRGPVLPALLMFAASVLMVVSSIALFVAASKIGGANFAAPAVVAVDPTALPPTPTASLTAVPPTPTLLPTAIPPTALPTVQPPFEPETSSWEYLTLQYSQMSASFGDPDSGYFVIGAVSDPLLTAQLFGEINACLDATWSERSRLCAAKVSRSLPYYMTALGELGWELVSIIDKSDSSTYGVEAHFKRLARTPSVETSM